MRSSLLEDLTGRFRGGSGKASRRPRVPRTDDAHDWLGDAEWPSQVHARSVRLRPLTALLSVALVALVGIWGGAELQKRHGSGTAASEQQRARCRPRVALRQPDRWRHRNRRLRRRRGARRRRDLGNRDRGDREDALSDDIDGRAREGPVDEGNDLHTYRQVPEGRTCAGRHRDRDRIEERVGCARRDVGDRNAEGCHRNPRWLRWRLRRRVRRRRDGRRLNVSGCLQKASTLPHLGDCRNPAHGVIVVQTTESSRKAADVCRDLHLPRPA